MKVAHHAEIDFEDWPGIRDEGALHRTLFQGEQGSPINFDCTAVRSPRMPGQWVHSSSRFITMP